MSLRINEVEQPIITYKVIWQRQKVSCLSKTECKTKS